MTDTTKTAPAEIADQDLDGVAGADSNHDKWIIIQSMGSPIYRSIGESRNTDGTVDAADYTVWRDG